MKVWKLTVLKCVGIVALAMIGVFAEGGYASPSLVGEPELQEVRGGGDKFCVGSLIDPNGMNCDYCLSNGIYSGNTSYSCNTNFLDMTYEFAPGQSPGQRWDFSETPCGGQGTTYPVPSCVGVFPPDGPCTRNYTKATFLGYSNGAYCGEGY